MERKQERKEKEFREYITKVRDRVIAKENKLRAEIIKNISLNKEIQCLGAEVKVKEKIVRCDVAKYKGVILKNVYVKEKEIQVDNVEIDEILTTGNIETKNNEGEGENKFEKILEKVNGVDHILTVKKINWVKKSIIVNGFRYEKSEINIDNIITDDSSAEGIRISRYEDMFDGEIKGVNIKKYEFFSIKFDIKMNINELINKRIDVEGGFFVNGAWFGVKIDQKNDEYEMKLDGICNDYLKAIPYESIGNLKHSKMSGEVKGSIKIKGHDVKINLLNKCMISSIPNEFNLKNLDKFKRETPEGVREEGPKSGKWTSLNFIPEHMIYAVMTTEDAGFMNHKGYSIQAIENSISLNIKEKKFVRGASTITMQLAKNIWLTREKNLDRKMKEMILSLYLEQNWSKNRIIEYYLNLAEFSGGIYGISEGSKNYFNINQSELTISQSVFLALCLPSPKSNHFDGEGKVSNSRLMLIRRVIKMMKEKNLISEEEYARSMREVPTFRGKVLMENNGENEETEEDFSWNE